MNMTVNITGIMTCIVAAPVTPFAGLVSPHELRCLLRCLLRALNGARPGRPNEKEAGHRYAEECRDHDPLDRAPTYRLLPPDSVLVCWV